MWGGLTWEGLHDLDGFLPCYFSGLPFESGFFYELSSLLFGIGLDWILLG